MRGLDGLGVPKIKGDLIMESGNGLENREGSIEDIVINNESEYRALRMKIMLRKAEIPSGDMYWDWMREEIAVKKYEQRMEIEEMLKEEQQKKEEQPALSREEERKKFEEGRNIKRDSKGRLNKGALLAKKDSCNEFKIYLMHEFGASVKEIVERYGCSKSVVYRALAKHKKS